MKKTTKAFTLVEMLIVIVIIGILIASLMPRMQSAQGRARDVARKNDLSQIQTAIITSQQDRGAFPAMAPKNPARAAGATADDNTVDATAGISIDKIGDNLQKAGMSSIPTDPNKSNKVSGLGSITTAGGNYAYLVAKRNAVKNGGFILMARTEVEGSSNFVTCNLAAEASIPTNVDDALAQGYITTDTDLAKVKICETVTKADTCDASACKYADNAELRYILMY